MMNPGVTDQVRRFFSQFPQRNFLPDQILIRAGQTVPALYFLESGVVQQSLIRERGQKVIITLYKPGAFFPLYWALSQQETSYEFTALTPVVVRLAPAKDVKQFLTKNGEVAVALAQRLLSALEALSRRIVTRSRGSAQESLLLTFLGLAYRFPNEKSEHSIVLPLTHQQLADLSGLNRETVTREIRKLKAAGWLRSEGRFYSVSSLALFEKQLGLLNSG